MALAATAACVLSATCASEEEAPAKASPAYFLCADSGRTIEIAQKSPDEDLDFRIVTGRPLSTSARRALLALAFSPWSYPSDLAKSCGLEAMEMVDAINELLEVGLIQRTESEVSSTA